MSKLKMASMDFDSTIADTRHRHHIIDRINGTDWNQYSLECFGDTPGPAFAQAKYFTDMDLPWIIVSGRSEIARAASWEWLRSYGLRPWHLYLCDDRHDYMSHGEWKAKRLLEIQAELDCEITIHYDDIKNVKLHAEAVGIPTVLVHDLNSPIEDHLG